MNGSTGGATASHDRNGKFAVGNTEYLAKRRRINERVQLLCAEYDANTPSRQILLAIAAQHLDTAERTHSNDRRVKATNAAARLLRQIPRRPLPAPPSLDSYRKAREGAS
jgi:hypothetical protein